MSGEGDPPLGRGTSISEREVCVVCFYAAVLGERAALVEAGAIFLPVLEREPTERTDRGGGECDSDEHAPSIGACVPSL